MYFYKTVYRVKDSPLGWEEERKKHFFKSLPLFTEKLCEESRNSSYTFLFALTNEGVIVLSASKKPDTDQSGKFMNEIGLSGDVFSQQEITFPSLINALKMARRQDFINQNAFDIADMFALGPLFECRDFLREDVVDEMLPELCEATAIYSLSEKTLLPELRRIGQGSADNGYPGHPVHYTVISDDLDNEEKICDVLLSALYAKGRITSKHYGKVYSNNCVESFDEIIKAAYRCCAGGAMIFRFVNAMSTDSAAYEYDQIVSLCYEIKKNRNDVLTIICLPHACSAARKVLRENLAGMSFVEIEAMEAKNERARECLRRLAAEKGKEADAALLSEIVEDKVYLTYELSAIVEEWYNRRMIENAYPQYGSVQSTRNAEASDTRRGSAYNELTEMIGLCEAKAIIDKILAQNKINRLYEERGIPCRYSSMHMVFTGNPGTAKTSVARLYARILQENGVLSRGHLVEVGRSDLVDRFVGWTARTVKEKFKEAAGGVLFIDEAYALCTERAGSFGEEAINTIVQEMENRRNDLVVIFAGYPNEMENFLRKNPGLRSRIAFHVNFEDYTTEELCKIAALIGKKRGLIIGEGVEEALAETFEAVRGERDFGNGRFARNLIEKAEFNKAERLLRLDQDQIASEDLFTIHAEDIDKPTKKLLQVKRPIGFAG